MPAAKTRPATIDDAIEILREAACDEISVGEGLRPFVRHGAFKDAVTILEKLKETGVPVEPATGTTNADVHPLAGEIIH